MGQEQGREQGPGQGCGFGPKVRVMRRTWLIVLLAVLLPLRGWAAVEMGVQWAAHGTLPAHGQASSDPVSVRSVIALPCHAEVALGPRDDPPGGQVAHVWSSPEEPGSGAHPCASCNLCHGTVGAPSAPLVPPDAPPRSGPPIAQPQDTGRLCVAALERPPRA